MQSSIAVVDSANRIPRKSEISFGIPKQIEDDKINIIIARYINKAVFHFQLLLLLLPFFPECSYHNQLIIYIYQGTKINTFFFNKKKKKKKMPQEQAYTTNHSEKVGLHALRTQKATME